VLVPDANRSFSRSYTNNDAAHSSRFRTTATHFIRRSSSAYEKIADTFRGISFARCSSKFFDLESLSSACSFCWS
jgi:hypothetical protein